MWRCVASGGTWVRLYAERSRGTAGMDLPKLERIETDDGTIWRVSHAGMVREHRQEWQARVFLQQALQQAASELKRQAP